MHSCISAIAASIVKIIEVNKAKILANSMDTEEATFVAEKSKSSNKCLAVKLLDIRNVVFKDRSNLLKIFIAGKNRLNITGIF